MLRLRKFILVFGDVVLAYFALWLTVVLGFWPDFSRSVLWQHFFPFTLLYLFWFIIFYIFGLYDLNLIRPKIELLTRVGGCFLVCFILGLGFFYLFPIFEITPKVNLVTNVLILASFLYLWRRAFYYLFSSIYLQRVAILGRNRLTNSLIKEIKSNPQLGYKFVDFIRKQESLPPQLKRRRIDLLIISQDLTSGRKLTSELYKCLPLRINFMDLSQAFENILARVPLDFLNQGWFLRNLRESEKKIYDKLKRIEDIIFASLLIALTSPLWLIFAVLIKQEDKGPVFYKQKRIGKDKKEFWLWKFRSMIEGAEKKKAVWAKKQDPRITKIGRFLRRSHLDEIPQMLNVLRGDISLVGPRPERPEFVRKLEKQIPHYHLRHIIKPGFTGWAQTKQFGKYARSIMDSQEKFQYDLYYIKNRSLFLDLGILLKTFQLFFIKN